MSVGTVLLSRGQRSSASGPQSNALDFAILKRQYSQMAIDGASLPYVLSTACSMLPTPPNAAAIQVILKRFDHPDEVRQMLKGRFEVVRIEGTTLGRARYEPGWRWSEHVGPGVGASRCNVEHLGMVLAGTATVAFDDGRVTEMRAGELFYVPPVPHDSWVVGDEPYVSLHFLGADHYAK